MLIEKHCYSVINTTQGGLYIFVALAQIVHDNLFFNYQPLIILII